MSNTSHENSDHLDFVDATEDPKVQLVATEPDRLLTAFITMARIGAEAPVTITLGSVVVTGHVISLASFLEGIGGQMLGAPEPNEIAAQIGQHFTDRAAELRTEDAAEAEAEEAQEPNPNEVAPAFLNLRDARMIDPSGHEFPLGYWRCQVSQITGWSFGSRTVR